MKTSRIEWRIEQIARTILYRYFGNIIIERMLNDQSWDIVVNYNDDTELQFGVIVKEANDELSSIKDKIIEHMVNVDYSQAINQMPVILMVVDESNESAKIAFLLGWRFGKPRIYRNFELRNLNQRNANICLQLIKSMDNVIRFLAKEDMNVIKRITFSRKLYENRIQQAEILYLRRLSAKYRLNQSEVVNEKERFERLLNGVPEEVYPQDDLDNIIYESVKSQFANAKVKSKLILLSTDLDDLQQYKSARCIHTSLIVTPELTGIPAVSLSFLDGLEMFHVEIDIFVNDILYQNAFEEVSFNKVEPFNGWIKKITEWNKQKETIRPISIYFR